MTGERLRTVSGRFGNTADAAGGMLSRKRLGRAEKYPVAETSDRKAVMITREATEFGGLTG